MKLWKKPWARVMIQIFLVVTMSLAFSFILHEADNGLVSANGNYVSTCLESNNGEICQEFPSDTCDSQCNGTCIQNSRDNVIECKLGNCYDPVEGKCLSNSPKNQCESFGGEWSEDSFGNIPECELGCCLTGEQAYFVTEQNCKRIRETTGVLTDFKPEIYNELLCWQESNSQLEGACMLGETCRFVTQLKCGQLGGDFYENFLCSHPDFESECEKQSKASCIEGLDGIYWVDSCGNRENIYEGSSESQKEHSWNDGKVLPLLDACELTDSNRDVCGNCDLLVGSTVCGEKTFSEKLKDDSQEVVCREASCIDNRGNRREHGESWCYYQGAVEPDKGDRGYLRSVSTPGSRHFKLWCENGNVHNVSCGERRDSICEETRTEDFEGKEISSANCKINTADLCIQYNSDKDDGMDKCKENPDCYVKRIDTKGANLDFKFCVPKYPKGFNLDDNPEYGKNICKIASLECKAAKIKKVSGWKWKNKGCIQSTFAKQMNDFCMSLGDCGASVNYVGEFSDSGYRVKKAPKLSGSYISNLRDYATTDPSEYIGGSTIKAIKGSLGIEGDLGTFDEAEFEQQDDITKEEWWGIASLGGGLGGMALYGWGQSIGSTIGMVSPAPGVASKLGTIPGSAFGPWLGAIGGAIVGAGIVGMLIQHLEIGAGLPPAVAYGLIGLGAVGGGMFGFGAVSTAGPGIGAIGAAGIWVVVAVVIVIVIFKIIGVGKVKYYKAKFSCKPWQPPKGGDDCSKCGSDGFPCSEYACESLGTGCQFVNEGSSFEECRYIPSNPGPPEISPDYNVLTQGFSYEDVSDNGFRVTALTEDGCIPAFTLVNIGIKLNEPGRCTFAVEDTAYDEGDVLDFLDESEFDSEDFGLGEGFLGLVEDDDSLQDYDENEDLQIDPGMDEFYLGGNNLFLEEHTHPLFMPSLGSLGIGGFDPDRRVEFDLRIRCEDTDGDRNPKDYVIRTCLSPEKDIFPPIVMSHDPFDNLTAYNSITQKISIYTNEPAECRYSSNDKRYNLMENEMQCENDPSDLHPRGFKCSTTLDIEAEEMNYYARCKDQPWFKGTVNESDRHTMNKSYAITLKRSDPLKISSISPEDGEVLIYGTEPASVEINVQTKGGGYNGLAECSYLSDDDWIRFFETFDDVHSQTFNQFTSGKKEITVKCEDTVGNIAQKSSEFEIKIDNGAPEAIRAYYENGQLKIATNEPAVCYYDYYRCNFDIENASSMSVGLATIHSTDWDAGKKYHIKCTDTWRNWESGCSTVVMPGEF